MMNTVLCCQKVDLFSDLLCVDDYSVAFLLMQVNRLLSRYM